MYYTYAMLIYHINNQQEASVPHTRHTQSTPHILTRKKVQRTKATNKTLSFVYLNQKKTLMFEKKKSKVQTARGDTRALKDTRRTVDRDTSS